MHHVIRKARQNSMKDWPPMQTCCLCLLQNFVPVYTKAVAMMMQCLGRYFIWKGSIKLPAPLQYANRLVKQAREVGKGRGTIEAQQKCMWNQLYYI